MDKEIKQMDKTPIQQEIERQQKHLDFLLGYKDYMFEKTKQISNTRAIISCLQSLLPTERQFAETCFDAGSERMDYNQHSYLEYAADFNEFFKQYTHD